MNKALKDAGITKSIDEAKTDVDVFTTGHFAFGANELPIIWNLNEILSYLEKHHGLVIDKATPLNRPPE